MFELRAQDQTTLLRHLCSTRKKKSVNLIYTLYCLCFNHIIFYHSLFWPKTGLKMSWNALMDLTGWDACHVFVTLWLWFLQYNLFCMSSFQLTFLVKISSVHWLVTSCIRMFVWCSGFLTRLLILKTVLCHYTRWHRFMSMSMWLLLPQHLTNSLN